MTFNKFFTLSALAGAFTLTACSVDDNPVSSPTPTVTTATISFEHQSLNADGYWIGEENENGISDGWGGMTYPCTYQESVATFCTSYSVYYWSGYAISNRTATSFDAATLTPDQYNNVVGTAKSGQNFCVVNTRGETINFSTPTLVRGLHYTNSAYTANSIVNGDAYSGAAFEQSDWLTCTVIGTKADGSQSTVDISLAKDGSYVADWQYADLSTLGEVESLAFSFSGSRSNEWGVLTPAYICIDDIEIEY